MKGTVLGFCYVLVIYFAIGLLKGGWNLYFFTNSEGFGKGIILVGGVFHATIALILYGIPAQWFTEWMRLKEIWLLQNTLYSRLILAGIVSALHAISTFDAPSVSAEFISMFVMLAPLPFFLDTDEKHIKKNWEREGKAWF